MEVSWRLNLSFTSYTLAVPIPNIDRRFFLGLPNEFPWSSHGRISFFRMRPPRPSRSRGDSYQCPESSDGAIEDGAMERASLLSWTVSRESVLAIEASYKVGSAELDGVDL